MAGFVRELLNTLSFEPRLDELSPVDRQALSRLDKRLAGFAQSDDGDAIKIRPGDCTVWDGNPRDQPGLSFDSCQSLIESIATEGGNRIPVLVRPNPPGASQPYELLVGSRRRFAIDWLNHNGRPELRLNALVVNLSDEEAFRLADIENRERQDISELDRARSYHNALERFYGGVQSRMAEALTLSNSQLSRLLALAELPEEVIDAFATRDEIRVRHSEVLTPLLRRPEARARILVEARRIGQEQQALALESDRMIAPAAVLARLKDAGAQQETEDDGEFIVQGQKLGRIRSSRSGGIQVNLSISQETDIDALIGALRDNLLAMRLREAEPDEAVSG